ncbi:SDR family oxidoreductase [Nakamurella sp. GG22]
MSQSVASSESNHCKEWGVTMTYVITGATGQLGRLAVESLLARGVEPGNILATGRNVERLKDLADRGVRTRAIDYDEIDSLRAAFSRGDTVLFVSGSEAGRRLAQHRNVIEAARQADVGLLAYTSIANAELSRMQLAAEHQATEEALAASGVPYTLLRNSFYLEVYTAQLPTYTAPGAVIGSAGGGRISAATRHDLAEAAAVVLLSSDQAGRIYELGGDTAFTLADLAAEVSAATGVPVEYRDLPEAQYAEILSAAGVPASFAAVLADVDVNIARGALEVTSGDLSRLIGHPTTGMPEAVRAVV